MIEVDLLGMVAKNGAYTALCKAAPYPLMLDTDAALPALTYQLISTVDDYTLDGPVGLTRSRIQIDAWGNTYLSAKALAAVVTTLLNGFTGPLATGVVYDTQRDGAHDEFDPTTRLYRVQTDWLVWSTT